MIVPSGRLVALAAAGGVPALALGIAAPALWPLTFAWLGALLVAAAADAARTPAGGSVTVAAPRLVDVGAAFVVEAALAAQPHADLILAGDPLLTLAAAGRASVHDGRVTVAATAARRGTARLARFDLRWRGPLGLIWRQRRQRLDREIRIVPDVRSVRRDGPTLLAADARTGLAAQLAVGSSGEFDALADFQRGMDRRQIDWKQSARHGTLLAKEYRAERDTNIVLAFDCGRTMVEPVAGLPRLDRALAAGLLTAYVALKTGDRITVFGFDARVRLASAALSGTGAFARVQAQAARLDYSPAETNFTLALSTLTARLDRRSLIILFTEFTDTVSAELMLRAVGPLLARHVLIAVVLRDDALEDIAAAEPVDADDVARAVVAAGLLRERRIVLSRLRRMGVEVLEAPWNEIGTALARRTLDAKRRGRV